MSQCKCFHWQAHLRMHSQDSLKWISLKEWQLLHFTRPHSYVTDVVTRMCTRASLGQLLDTDTLADSYK